MRNIFKPKIWGPTEKAMAPHSSTLACKIPWIFLPGRKPGRLRFMGSLTITYD